MTGVFKFEFASVNIYIILAIATIARSIKYFFVTYVSFTLCRGECCQSNHSLKPALNKSEPIGRQIEPGVWMHYCTNTIPIHPLQDKGNPQASKEQSGSLQAGQVCRL